MVRQTFVTARCVSTLEDIEFNCSQPLYFQTHAKEKASVKHEGVGAGK